jgi:hypothetical protein
MVGDTVLLSLRRMEGSPDSCSPDDVKRKVETIITEGGAIEVNGTGTLLATRSLLVCLGLLAFTLPMNAQGEDALSCEMAGLSEGTAVQLNCTVRVDKLSITGVKLNGGRCFVEDSDLRREWRLGDTLQVTIGACSNLTEVTFQTDQGPITLEF